VIDRGVLAAIVVSACTSSPPPRATAPAPNIVVAAASAASTEVTPTSATPSGPARLPADFFHAPGCFAWSSVRKKAMCIVGSWAANTPAAGEPALIVLSPEARDEPTVGVGDDFQVRPDVRRKLDDELVAGRFTTLPSPRRLAVPSVERIRGFEIRMQLDEVYLAGAPSPHYYDFRALVRHRDAERPTIDYGLKSLPCEPVVRVYDLDSIGVLFESVCEVHENGQVGYDSMAWLCSGTTCR
jgi:hypothetical protein